MSNNDDGMQAAKISQDGAKATFQGLTFRRKYYKGRRFTTESSEQGWPLFKATKTCYAQKCLGCYEALNKYLPPMRTRPHPHAHRCEHTAVTPEEHRNRALYWGNIKIPIQVKEELEDSDELEEEPEDDTQPGEEPPSPLPNEVVAMCGGTPRIFKRLRTGSK